MLSALIRYIAESHKRFIEHCCNVYLTGLLKSVKTFDIHFKAEYGEMLTAYINAAPKNVIIAIAGQDEPSRYFATVKDALQSVGGTRSTLEDRSSYVLLGFKGNLSVNWTVDAYSGSGKGPTTLRRTIKLPPGILCTGTNCSIALRCL